MRAAKSGSFDILRSLDHVIILIRCYLYRLTDKSGSWRVYDVIIEGVSMVKNYRTQFRQILAKDSPEKLLEILRDKVGKG